MVSKKAISDKDWHFMKKYDHLPSDTSETVDTNVNRLEAVGGSLAVDNVSEFGLEGGSSDKESINIGLRREARGGLGTGRSTVKDASALGNLGSGNLAEVLTDVSMGVLGLFRGGGQTSSNGPDGFVGNDDLLPVLLGEGIGISLDLRENILVGGSSLPLLKGLSTACHDRQTLVQGVLGLGGDLNIALSLSTAFRMSNNNPADSHISKHISAGLTSEGAISLHPAILGTDRDIAAKSLLHLLDVNLRWADDNLGISGKSGLVDHGNKIVGLGDSTIALPVSSDEELAGFHLARRVVGPKMTRRDMEATRMRSLFYFKLILDPYFSRLETYRAAALEALAAMLRVACMMLMGADVLTVALPNKICYCVFVSSKKRSSTVRSG
jgi:hypothetical protein